MTKSLQEVITELGYGHLYEKPSPPKPEPSYCIFCCDASEDDLAIHGGCACCGNNGAYDSP